MLRDGGPATVDEAFASAPSELRRPVELLGYLELAAPGALDDVLAGGDVPADRLRRVTAVRADGSTRDLVLPQVPIAVPEQGDDEQGDDEGGRVHDPVDDDPEREEDA